MKVMNQTRSERAGFRRVIYSIQILVLFYFFVSVPNGVAQGGLIDQVFKDMDTYNSKLVTLQADLVRVKANPQLGTMDAQTGKVLYAAANPKKKTDMMIRVDFTRPDEFLSVLKGRYVMYTPGRNQAWTGKTSNVKSNNNAVNLFAFFRMSRSELKRNFTAKYLDRATLKNGVVTSWLELNPIGKAGYKTVEIWVDGIGRPVQTRVNELSGDTTTVLLSNFDENKKINAAKFQIKIAGGTNVHEEK
jgi:outer membrane lipoprotein-sorting protein